MINQIEGEDILMIRIKHTGSRSISVSYHSRNIINNYMTVVLNEKPLDETLVDFDDSLAW